MLNGWGVNNKHSRAANTQGWRTHCCSCCWPLAGWFFRQFARLREYSASDHRVHAAATADYVASLPRKACRGPSEKDLLMQFSVVLCWADYSETMNSSLSSMRNEEDASTNSCLWHPSFSLFSLLLFPGWSDPLRLGCTCARHCGLLRGEAPQSSGPLKVRSIHFRLQ